LTRPGQGVLQLRAIILLVALAMLAACGSSSEGGSHGSAAGPRHASITNPHEGGYYKIGQPYEVDGVTYTPAEDYSYDETGIASWYGPGFHGLRTANGEMYDMNQVTAAHKTLPMPSLVRVTNLDNGRSVVVRVNDRGPFVRNRIIDMSRRGAQLLGYEKVGTAKVRVQIMATESRALAAAAKQGVLVADVANIDPDQPPPLPPGTPTYTRPGAPPPVEEEQPAYRSPPPQPSVAPLAPPPSTQYAQEQTPPPAVATVDEKAVMQQALGTQQVKGQDVAGMFMPAPVATQRKVHPTSIYIQAGAFGVADNAQRMLAKLQGVGHAEITQAMVNGKMFYRVRVGPIADVDQADTMLSRVVNAGANGAKIIVD
jgi:rare lipoprotein A